MIDVDPGTDLEMTGEMRSPILLVGLNLVPEPEMPLHDRKLLSLLVCLGMIC